MTLNTLTVGTVNITVPSAYKVPGTRGTPAPKSVVNVLNDYMFYNAQAVYNYGPRQQFSNFLSTDEVTADIRPNVEGINRGAEDKVASVYYRGDVLVSVPTGLSTENDKTMLYSTELKAWMPTAFTIGFSRFLPYTEIVGVVKKSRLLAHRPGDNRLSYIDESITGDYGQPFATELVTGLYQTMKDPFGFQTVEEMQTEFSQPQGGIYAELLGDEMRKGFHSIKTIPIRTSSTTVEGGWDTHLWDADEWDTAPNVTIISSEKSVPRYSTVQKDLRSVQWHIFTNELESRYILRRLRTWGGATDAGHPTSWRVNKI